MDNNELQEVPKENLPIAEFVGKMNIGGYDIQCAVLYPDAENPIRVFWLRELVGLLTGNKKGGLERYFKPDNLQPYLPEKYKNGDISASTIQFKTMSGQTAYGFLGSDIIDICRMYMKAKSDGKLLPSQFHLADKSEVIVFSFAKTGVDAIIDTITGYEKVRPDFALLRNLDKYVSEELKRYKSQFPIEFYKLIFKLNGWPYTDETIGKRPGIIGKWTNEIIYARFPKGVFSKISELNSRDVKGRLKNRNYYFLTEQEGLSALKEYLSNAMFLMNSSSNWKKFMNSLRRALGKDYQGDLWE